MNITLIGMAGSGKSLVGKILAKKLHYEFIDVDKIIQKKTESRLQTIVDKFGEKRFGCGLRNAKLRMNKAKVCEF